MSEPTSRPSGIRPPSKIGRPCFGSVPKPAIPQTPKTNGTTSSVRKLTEDLLKTRINEEIEEEEPFHGYGRRESYERKSSIGGVSSNDSLWGEARRFSEAGIRRTSDNSVILTEDTDSFIVGDKVWVGGTKPGRIAFIGETHFAAGDWAGIVLDEPIGKNDGSIGGTRYFQCESKKGVFSKLGRLTRYPMAVPSPPLAPSPSPPPSVASFSRRTTPPPVPRTPPLISPPSPAPSTRGEASVGDRVIVMSGQGSKIGILRYRGETGFASGIWCGVELDDPIGKNDGAVEGIRYFDCLPKYGLFAPAAKVTRSPAPDRRPSCQIHHTSVRRTSSKESLTSVTSRASTVASTASRVRLGVNSLKKPLPRASTTAYGTPKATPQELLKAKQDQIEKLLKDRDLDRSRMVKAAEQTEEAEKQLNLLKAEFDLFRVESHKKTQELEDDVKKIQQEKSDLVTQLEDWKFRADEEAIFKSTLEEEQEEQQQCMDAWKKAFSEKEEEVKNLLLQVSELKETKGLVEQMKNEIDTLKTKATENENELKKELIETIDRANRMEQNYNDVQNEFENNSSLKNEIGPLKDAIAKLEVLLSESENKRELIEKASIDTQEMLKNEKNISEDMKQQLLVLENKLKEALEYNKLLGEEDKELKSKCADLSSLSTQVNQLTEELARVHSQCKVANDENDILKKNLEELQTSKVSMLEEQDTLQKSIDEWKKTLSEKEEEIKKLFVQVDELSKTKHLMSALNEETESFRKKASEIEIELKKELIDTMERANKMEENFNESEKKMQTREVETNAELTSLREMIAELQESLSLSVKSTSDLQNSSKKAQLKIEEQDKIIENIKKEVHDLEYKLQEAETYNKLLGEGEQKLKAQCAEMSNLLTQVNQFRNDLSDAQNKYKSTIEQNESLRKELNEIQTSSNNKLIDIDKKYNNDIQNLTKKLEEFSSELSHKEKELSEEKIKVDEHEREFSSLQKELVDLKTSLEINQNNLNDKETEICLLKKDLEETKEQLNNSVEHFEQSKVEFSTKITQLKNELGNKKSDMKNLESENNNLLSSYESEKKVLIEKLTYLENTVKSLNSDTDSYKNEINLKNDEFTSQLSKYNELNELYLKQTTELESNKSQIKSLESKIQDSENKRSNLEVITESLKQALQEKEKLIAEINKQISNTEQEYQNEKEIFMKEIKSLENVKTKLEDEKNHLMKSVEKFKESISEKESEISNMHVKLQSQEKQEITKISSLKETNAELELSLAETEKKRQILEQNLNSAELTLKQQEMILQESKKEIRDLDYKLQETETYNKLLGEEEQELKKKCADLSNLMTQVNQLQEEICVKESNYKNILDQNENLIKEISVLSNDKILIVSEKEKLERSIENINKIISNKDNELQEANSLILVLKADIISLKQETLEMKEKLENDLLFSNSRVCELQCNLDSLLNSTKTEQQKAEIEITSLKERIIDLENSLSDHRGSKSDLETKLEKTEFKIQELESTIDQQKNTIHDLDLKLKSEEERYCKFMSEEQEKLNIKTTEVNNLSLHTTTLEGELEKLKNDYEAISKHRDELMNNFIDLETQYSAMKEEEEKVRMTVDEAHNTLIKKEQEIKTLTLQLDDLTETKKNLTASVESLESFKKNAINAEEIFKEEFSKEVDRSNNLEKRLIEAENNHDKFQSDKNIEITVLKDTISKLDNSLSDSNRSNEKLNVDLSNAVSKTLELEKELSNLKQINDDLQNRLMSNANLNEVGEQLLKKKSEEINELVTKLSSLKEELSISEIKHKTAIEEALVLKIQLNDIKSSADNQIIDINKEHSEKIESITMKMNEYVLQLEKKDDELSEIKIKFDEQEKEHNSLKITFETNMINKEKEMILLKNELDETKTQLENVRIDTEDLNNKYLQNCTTVNKELEEAKERIVDLETAKNDLISMKNVETEKLKKNISSLENNVSALLIEIEKHKNETVLKENELSLLQDKFNELDECFKKQNLEFDVKTFRINELEVQIEDISAKYQQLLEKESELELLKTSSSMLSNEKESVHEELLLTKKNLIEMTTNLSKSEENAMKKEKILSDDLLKLKDSLEKTNTKYNQLHETSTKNIQQLENKCSELTKSLEMAQNLSQKIDSDTLERLNETEETNKSLLNQINVKKESEKQLEKIIKDLNAQIENEKSTNVKTLAEIEMIKKDNQNKINVLEAQLTVLVREKEILEDKTKHLSNEVSTLTLKASKKSPEGTEEDSEMAAWLEERELAASEINFLNSIIVDMQKKNDILSQHIQAIELGEASGEMNGVKKKKKKEVAPRLFCDICDVFDAHDTEDCPRQASAGSPPPAQNHTPQPRGVVRPYCEICEVFGHNTGECDDTETF